MPRADERARLGDRATAPAWSCTRCVGPADGAGRERLDLPAGRAGAGDRRSRPHASVSWLGSARRVHRRRRAGAGEVRRHRAGRARRRGRRRAVPAAGRRVPHRHRRRGARDLRSQPGATAARAAGCRGPGSCWARRPRPASSPDMSAINSAQRIPYFPGQAGRRRPRRGAGRFGDHRAARHRVVTDRRGPNAGSPPMRCASATRSRRDWNSRSRPAAGSAPTASWPSMTISAAPSPGSTPRARSPASPVPTPHWPRGPSPAIARPADHRPTRAIRGSMRARSRSRAVRRGGWRRRTASAPAGGTG